jgi:HIV Tat-specific factor 1
MGSSTFPTDPSEFDADDRISYSTLDKKFLLVQDDGSEYEFDDVLKRWVPLLDESLLEQQQRAYAVAGVDESAPVEAQRKKRKKEHVNGENEEGGRTIKAAKKEKKPLAPRQNTAVYVTGLPPDATVSEVAEVFSRKCGVIAEEIDSGAPRIKLYTNTDGTFKGDALVVFFKPASVQLAIMLLDDTDFRVSPNGQGSGKMRVQEADMSYKKVQHDNGESNGSGTGASKPAEKGRAKTIARDKQKIIKKTQKLDARLADWSDDEEPSALTQTSNRWDKVVILKHMFTLHELDEDPAAMLEIKEDIREECSKLGNVTNVVLYDMEEDGIASVRFATPEAAKACVSLMNGRAFDGRTVQAYIADGKENFKKSSKKEDHDDSEDDVPYGRS